MQQEKKRIMFHRFATFLSILAALYYVSRLFATAILAERRESRAYQKPLEISQSAAKSAHIAVCGTSGVSSFPLYKPPPWAPCSKVWIS